ncbi:MAG: formate dehydrogenase accessory sulfurtransferase FdhD [Chloroflexi bacterium]|nr:formate dehydrogenase accessory sulfurtransferase FdhD [Chloroflexota bacterium]
MTAADLASDLDDSTAEVQIVSWQDRLRSAHRDILALEEPLEIRLAGCSVAVTMRTPGDDFDLAAGFLFTEGIIRGPGDIASIAHCPRDEQGSREASSRPFSPSTTGADQGSGLTAHGSQLTPATERRGDGSNIVNINPSDPAIVDPSRWQRNFFATSSCGICGKASIEAVCRDVPALDSRSRIAAGTLYRLGAELRRAQAVFSRTGGLHAAGLFDLDGGLITLREDVGRHNAVDKVVGDMLRRGEVPLHDHVLMVSGRASFEIMQKALAARIPIVAAVSAPSSLAVELARTANMTLVGFLRGDRFNVYAGADRVVPDE